MKRPGSGVGHRRAFISLVVAAAALFLSTLAIVKIWRADGSRGSNIVITEFFPGETEAILVKGPLRVRLFRDEPHDLAPGGLEISVNGGLVFQRKSTDEEFGIGSHAGAAIVPLDASASLPAVIFTSYDGGMRCCWTVSIIAPKAGSQTWSEINLEQTQGLGVSEPKSLVRQIIDDIDGDGQLEIVDEQRFYGLFCDDRSVISPLRIRRLVDGRLVDVSREPKYLPAHRKHFERLWKFAQGDYVSNRDIPGLVASARLVGEGSKAWEYMRRHYQEPGSAIGIDEPCWPAVKAQSKLHKLTFPQQLAIFLAQNGYGERENPLSSNTDWSSP